MKKDQIVDVVREYVQTPLTQYVILINGSWGCGKTFFWKSELAKVVIGEDFKPIYISLNGIKDVGGLNNLLFLRLIPYFGKEENKLAMNAGTVLKNLANAVSKKLINATSADIFKGLSVENFNFSNYIICFDDLERCQIPIKELFGFINNLVEHKSLKALIFSDESQIDPEQKGYYNIKEKLIGRVLNFELSKSEIFPNLIRKYESSNNLFYDFLVDKQQPIIQIFVDYKQNNLRTLSFYLAVLEKIFPTLTHVESNYVDEVMFFAAIISFEFKYGNLKSSECNDWRGLDILGKSYHSFNIKSKKSSPFLEDDEVKDIPKSYVQNFYDTYLDNRNINFFFSESIFTYILSGYLDLSKLQLELKQRSPETIPDHIQDFRLVTTYDFRDLSEEEYKGATTRVLLYAKEGKYTIYDYVQLAKFYYFFAENKLVPFSTEEIREVIDTGLKKAKQHKKIDQQILENLLHFTDENIEVTRTKSLVEQIHNDIKRDLSQAAGNELESCLLHQDENSLKLLLDKYAFSTGLFEYLDPLLLLQALANSSNKKISMFTRLLKTRYTSANIGDFLIDDLKFLEMLSVKVECHILSLHPLTLRKFLMRELIVQINDICLKLSASTKQQFMQ